MATPYYQGFDISGAYNRMRQDPGNSGYKVNGFVNENGATQDWLPTSKTGGSYQYNGLNIDPYDDQGSYRVYQGGEFGKGIDGLNGVGYDVYNRDGQYQSSDIFRGIKDSTPESQMVKSLAVILGGYAAGNALTGLAGTAGAGAGTAGAAAGGVGGAGTGVVVGGPMSVGLPVGTALPSMGAMGGMGAAGAGGLASALSGGGGASTLTQMLTQYGPKAISAISALTGIGGGGSGAGGGGLGGLGSLNGLTGLASALYGGKQQADASKDMIAWLNGQQAKIDGLYAPNSPEYNSLWDEMSRKDAAAGRNSQYGPRSVDLAAKIASTKADHTSRLTTGIGNTYAAALNSGANAYAGVPAILGNQLAGGGLSGILGGLGGAAAGGLDKLIASLSTPGGLGSGMSLGANGGIDGIDSGWTGGTLSNEEIENMINGWDFGELGF